MRKFAIIALVVIAIGFLLYAAFSKSTNTTSGGGGSTIVSHGGLGSTVASIAQLFLGI